MIQARNCGTSPGCTSVNAALEKRRKGSIVEEARPLVSVIMPTYNCGEYIAQTVESVLAQSLGDWELQIVDDCSTDNTYEVLLPYLERDARIRYTLLEEKGGAQMARTRAIAQARGKYIAFLDSDDLWEKGKLEKQVAFMEADGKAFSATAYDQIDENGEKRGIALYPPKRTDYKKMLRCSNPIGNSTVMYDQDRLGKYAVPNIQKRNDFALWLQILKNCDCCYGMQEILTSYRTRPGSTSSNKLSLAQYHWQLYREIEGLPFWKSAWYLLCWAWIKGTGLGIDKRRTL